MNAIYDLSKMPTTFDFAAWLVIARTHGCTNVHFVTDKPMPEYKYPPVVSWARFGNMLAPMCELAGMTFTTGTKIKGQEFWYLAGNVEKTYRKFGRIEKLKPVIKPRKTRYVTITMRDSFRNQYRNSNEIAWKKFEAYLRAKGREVIVIPECESTPMPISWRLTTYCGADMNLGASGGPMWFCHFSDAPCIILNMVPKRPKGEEGYDLEELMASSGFPFGSQFSFRTPQQKLIWKPDTFENIVEAYEDICQTAAA